MYHTDIIPTDCMTKKDPKWHSTAHPEHCPFSHSKSVPPTEQLMQSLGLILYQIIPHPKIADIGHNYHSDYFVPGTDSTETVSMPLICY